MPPEFPFDPFPGWNDPSRSSENDEVAVPRVVARRTSDAGWRRDAAALYAMAPGIMFLFICALYALLRG